MYLNEFCKNEVVLIWLIIVQMVLFLCLHLSNCFNDSNHSVRYSNCCCMSEVPIFSWKCVSSYGYFS